MIAHAETYRFSIEEYHKLGEVGILDEDDRIELLDGELIIMAPLGKHHAKAVRRLGRKLNAIFADVAFVDCQNAVILGNFSEPQPDFLLLRPEIDNTDELPRPADILLLVEVADSSLRFDATTKLRAYARASLPEYWIVNLAERAVDVYRQPVGDTYTEHFRRERHETLAPAAFPDRSITVAEILP